MGWRINFDNTERAVLKTLKQPRSRVVIVGSVIGKGMLFSEQLYACGGEALATLAEHGLKVVPMTAAERRRAKAAREKAQAHHRAKMERERKARESQPAFRVTAVFDDRTMGWKTGSPVFRGIQGGW